MNEFLRALLSPFVPALLTGLIASVITYLFTMRTKKFEILFHERVPAFKIILRRLNGLRRYCMAYAPKGDLMLRPRDLPKGEPKSALEHHDAIQDAMNENYVFLPTASIDSLYNVERALQVLCKIEMEATIAGKTDRLNDADSSLHEHYEAVTVVVDECIKAMYKQLALPGN